MDDLIHAWGEPIEFNGLSLHPVRMQNSTKFYECVNCLMIEKNKSPDIEIIKMSYLRFLFVLAYQYPDVYGHLELNLIKMLKLCFQTENIKFNATNEIKIIVDEVAITEEDFEDIRKYILKQNLIQISEIIYDAEIEQALNEAREFMSNKSKNATLEEQIFAFHCVSGRSFPEIKEYTIYQFGKCTERYVLLKNFEVYSSLLAENGSSKDIQHWLSRIEEKGIHDDVLIDKDNFVKETSDLKV